MSAMVDKKSFIVYKDIDLEGLTLSQIGELFKAMVDYSNNREVEISDPEVKGMWRGIKRQMDDNDKQYQNRCATNKRIAEEREAKKREERERTYTNVNERTRKDTKHTDTDTDKDTDKDKDTEYPTGTEKKSEEKSGKRPSPPRHKHGEFGHVLLTEEQFDNLCNKHGDQATLRAIDKVDRYCEETGKTYKNYALVLEKWGYEPDRKTRSGTADDNPYDHRKEVASWHITG